MLLGAAEMAPNRDTNHPNKFVFWIEAAPISITSNGNTKSSKQVEHKFIKRAGKLAQMATVYYECRPRTRPIQVRTTGSKLVHHNKQVKNKEP